MINKGYNIDAETLNERLLNNLEDYGFNLKYKKEVDILKDNVRRKNLTNRTKPKAKR